MIEPDESVWREGTTRAEIDGTVDVARNQPPGVIVVLSGGDVGKTHLLHTSVVIGRDEGVDIRIDRSDVSRRHAAIELRAPGQFVLRDLGSRNGTLLNGVRITEEPLAFGDHIGIGPRSTLLFANFEPVPEEVQRQQRVESLGRLASGVAHDFNNLLTVIMGSLSFLLDLETTATLGERDVHECLVDALTAAKRSGELTQQLLSFARGENTSGMEVSDLAEIAGEVLRIAQRAFGSSITVESSIESGLYVFGDRSQLVQVLMNLCLNARDAMPAGGRLTITGKKQGPVVTITVEDSGVGMSEETKARVFDPFFTTKPKGKGTGLGLSIVAGIVKNHGGTIDLESELGRGTKFTVGFPLAEKETEEHLGAVRGGAKTLEVAKGAVLIVDDEDLQLRTTRRLVEALGHPAFVAKDRSEAVALFKKNRHEIELVLLDVVMPDGGGQAIYGALKQIDPNVRVLACSGYSAPDLLRSLMELGARGFLQKPYDRKALQLALLKAMA